MSNPLDAAMRATIKLLDVDIVPDIMDCDAVAEVIREEFAPAIEALQRLAEEDMAEYDDDGWIGLRDRDSMSTDMSSFKRLTTIAQEALKQLGIPLKYEDDA